MNGQIPFREVDLRLQKCRTVWLTTTSRDGDHHCVPISFLWESDTGSLFFISSPRAAKARHLSFVPQVILHAGEGSDTIILEGTAQEVDAADERQRVNAAWQTKYAAPCAGMQLYQVQIKEVIVREYDRGNTRTYGRFEAPPVSV